MSVVRRIKAWNASGVRWLDAASQSLVVRFAELLGKLAILAAALTWLLSADERRAERYNSDLGIFLRTNGQPGDLGRARLLRSMLSRGESLAGLPLRKAGLEAIDLHGADLRGADLREANLSNANLSDADLSGAHLSCATLIGARLDRAKLVGTTLVGSTVGQASLVGATIKGSDLRGIILYQARFDDAVIEDSKLSGANGYEANFSRARHIIDADLEGADFHDAKLPRKGFEGDANHCRTTLPDGRILRPDCKPEPVPACPAPSPAEVP